MNKKTANKKYDLNKGEIIGALRALGLSEKAKPIREGLRDILATFIEFTDEIEGIECFPKTKKGKTKQQKPNRK